MQEVVGGVIGETEITAGKILIEDGSAEEAAELLLFHGVAREGQNMSAAGEDHAGDAAIERSEENQAAFVKGDFGVATAKRDAIGGDDLIDGGGIEAQVGERVVHFVGGAGGRGRRLRGEG